MWGFPSTGGPYVDPNIFRHACYRDYRKGMLISGNHPCTYTCVYMVTIVFHVYNKALMMTTMFDSDVAYNDDDDDDDHSACNDMFCFVGV